MKHIIFILIFTFICGCDNSTESGEIREVARVTSSNGNIAYISESSNSIGKTTQVIVEFSGGNCGAGAAHAYDTNIGLSISWLSETVLEISHPPAVELGLNASGNKLQCNDKFIHVKLNEVKALNKAINNRSFHSLDATTVAPVI